MQALLTTLLPLIGIILLGAMIRYMDILKREEIEGFKRIIVKLILPLVLFSSFSHTELSVTTWLIALAMFAICLLLYLYGTLGAKWLRKIMPYDKSGAFMTGFEFGMMGVGLLAAIWGEAVLPLVMPVALGHELFIWFFYAPNLNRMPGDRIKWMTIVKEFVSTPTVVGISMGIAINALGIVQVLGGTTVGIVLFKMIGLLTPVVGPLILLYIGFNLQFSDLSIKETVVYSMLRWIGVGLAVAISIHVFQWIDPDLEPLFYAGMVGFLLLPPPFIIPLFVKDVRAKRFYTQLLLTNTLLSFIGYAVALLIL